jgi:hypothetical protein
MLWNDMGEFGGWKLEDKEGVVRYEILTDVGMRVLPSETQRHIVRWKPTDASEEYVVWIIRVGRKAKQETRRKLVLL